MIDLAERGKMCPPFDICVDARAVYDVISASDACEPAECSMKLHLISVRDRMAHGLVRKFHWVDTRDMLADGPTKGGIDWLLLHRFSNECMHETRQLAISRTKVGSATNPLSHQEAGFEHGNASRGLDDPDQP